MLRFTAPPPTEDPFDWCVKNVVFADTEVSGAFDPTGRQYLREIVNNIADQECREFTHICATGVSKTSGIMLRHIWTLVHNPRRALMAMPATKGPGGSETYVTSRFIPALEATRATRDMMPDGQRRLYMNSKKVRLNGSHFDFIGGNSPAQASSNRCGLIDIDELDKMKGRLGNEAGLRQLIGERTEGVKEYFIFQSTTPTVETGQGWKCLTRSDFRLRFLPCPHCNSEARHRHLLEANSLSESNLKGWLTLAWNEQFCVLPLKFDVPHLQNNGLFIPRAYVVWDKEAKRKTGDWDKDRAARSARHQCQHCGGHIRDQHKVWMDENGVWIPTKESIGHKGYHLSALYAPPLVKPESDPLHKSLLAGRVLKFFDSIEEGEGMKNFINSTLAEVDVRQEHGTGKIELNSVPVAQPDWVALLTADFQKNWPYLWFLIRKWCAFKFLPPYRITNGKSEFVEALANPENAEAKKIVEQFCGVEVGRVTPCAPPFEKIADVVGELGRFCSRTGKSPELDFLLSQKITGERLLNFYTESAGPLRDIVAFRKAIYREMSVFQFGKPDAIRAPIGGDSELIAAGYCELSGEFAWQELADRARDFEVGKGMPIPGNCVAVDAGFGDKFNRVVLQKCYEGATEFSYWDPTSKAKPWIPYRRPIHNFCLPVARNGWFALRGTPTNRPLGAGKINHEIGSHLEDPYYGGPNAGTCMVEVLEIPQSLFWLRKDDLRNRKTKNTFTVSPKVSFFPKIVRADHTVTDDSNFKLADLERHFNEQYYDERKGKVEPKHGRGGSQGRLHPYHLDDCDVYQLGLATHFEFFDHRTANDY